MIRKEKPKIHWYKNRRPSPLFGISFEDWKLPEVPGTDIDYVKLTEEFQSLVEDSNSNESAAHSKWVQGYLTKQDLPNIADEFDSNTKYIHSSFLDFPEKPCLVVIVPLKADQDHSTAVVQQLALAEKLNKTEKIVNVHLLFVQFEKVSSLANSIFDELQRRSFNNLFGGTIVFGPFTEMGLVIEGSETYGKHLIHSIQKKMKWVTEPEYEEVQNFDIQKSFDDDYISDEYEVLFIGGNEPEVPNEEMDPDRINEFLFNSVVLLSKLYIEYELDSSYKH